MDNDEGIGKIPPVPLEIWSLILGHLVNNNNFPEIWTTCQKVSPIFKKAAELAFMSTALPEVDINLSLIGIVGHSYTEFARLQFKGFSQDGQRVHYGDPADNRLLLQSECCAGESHGLIHDDRTHGNLPLLIEWTNKIYISVCRGPASYYTWSEQYKKQLRHVWLRPNTVSAMEMIVHHTRHEVSFLWRPMLEIFLANVSKPLKQRKLIEQSRTIRPPWHGFGLQRPNIDEEGHQAPPVR
jgi:hypothetical protein